MLALHGILCSQNKGLALHKTHQNKLQTNFNIRWKLTNGDGRADGTQFRIRYHSQHVIIIHLFYSTASLRAVDVGVYGKSDNSGVLQYTARCRETTVVATQCWRLTPSICKALRGNTSTFNYRSSRAWPNAGCAFSICCSTSRNPKTYVHISLFQRTCTFGCRQRCSV